MTTTITIATGANPVLLEERDNIDHGDSMSKTEGYQLSQTFIEPNSRHECYATKTRRISVSELPAGATSLKDMGGDYWADVMNAMVPATKPLDASEAAKVNE